jgi:hypothetical protein
MAPTAVPNGAPLTPTIGSRGPCRVKAAFPTSDPGSSWPPRLPFVRFVQFVEVSSGVAFNGKRTTSAAAAAASACSDPSTPAVGHYPHPRHPRAANDCRRARTVNADAPHDGLSPPRRPQNRQQPGPSLPHRPNLQGRRRHDSLQISPFIISKDKRRRTTSTARLLAYPTSHCTDGPLAHDRH